MQHKVHMAGVKINGQQLLLLEQIQDLTATSFFFFLKNHKYYVVDTTIPEGTVD